jgi:hypothetical protein
MIIKESNLIKSIDLRLSNADYILTQTYPLLKDPKILLAVLENINLAINDIISLATKNYLNKNNSNKSNLSFKDDYDLFKRNYSKHIGVVKEIRSLWENRKECTVEFIKNDKLYLCSNDYEIRIISEDEMKKFLSKTIILFKEIRG